MATWKEEFALGPQPASYVAFDGARQVALGPLRSVLPVLKERFDRDGADSSLVFEVETGRQVDFDLRGSLDEVLERHMPVAPRGPGRPRLGVTSREVTLLPRHWEWLERQPNGISPAIRRLVEHAIKASPGREQARRIRAALNPFLTAMAGNRPNYEEACRSLFSGDTQRFASLVKRWPKDIREYAVERALAAAGADRDGPLDGASNTTAIAELYQRVWSEGDYDAIERLIAPRYVVHSDPGDAWEGQTLDRAGYEERVRYSRAAFPDLVFTIHDLIAAEKRVAVRWSAIGTQRGALTELPATGKRLSFSGQTIYELEAGQVAGHWQTVDRLGFMQQVRPPDRGVHP
jgi:steroid delta-isomerase-like uncharacterized protein